MGSIIGRLLTSDEPSIRYKIRTGVLGEAADSPSIKKLQEEIRDSPRVMSLLSMRSPSGTIPGEVYRKWNGAHWVLAVLGIRDGCLLYEGCYARQDQQNLYTLQIRSRC